MSAVWAKQRLKCDYFSILDITNVTTVIMCKTVTRTDRHNSSLPNDLDHISKVTGNNR